MTPNELLKNWLSDTDIAQEKILRTPGLQIPVTWGRQQAFINFAQPIPNIIFAVQLDMNGEVVFLGLSKSAECNDLPLLAANIRTSPVELLMAVFEAQIQYTLAALSQPLGISPKIVDIVPIDSDVWRSAVPFTLATVEKQALIANGLLAMPQSLLAKYALLDYVSPLDASIVPETLQKATAIAAHFMLDQPDAMLEIGDYLMLPEIKAEQYPWPLILLLDNGITLKAELADDQTIQLTDILDASPIEPDELVVSVGAAMIRYEDMLAMMQGKPVALPLSASTHVLKNGQIIARGHITSFYNNTALEIEA